VPPLSQQQTGAERSPLVSFFGIALVVVVAVMLAFLVFRESPADRDPSAAQAHPAAGMPLPELRIEPLVGARRPLTLPDLRGKVVLVNLWGPWCRPCRRELPELAELSYSLREREDFLFLPIAYGTDDNAESLRRDTVEFLRDVGHEIACYHDPDQSVLRALPQLQLEPAFPTTLLLDARGRVNAVWQGYHPGVERQMATAIDQLLGAAD
jgi:thiol-disulfide isomerase/thioredoxin